VELPLGRAEITLEVVAGLGFVGLVLYTALVWPSLPERIATHFGAAGRPDAWGPRGTFLILPGMGVVLGLGLTALSRFPHVYNYLWPITPGNAARQYRIARRMVIALKAALLWTLFAVAWGMGEVATGRRAALAPWTVFVPLALTFAVVGLSLVAAYRAREG
jgi:uncharacterized membrane protein